MHLYENLQSLFSLFGHKKRAEAGKGGASHMGTRKGECLSIKHQILLFQDDLRIAKQREMNSTLEESKLKMVATKKELEDHRA